MKRPAKVLTVITLVIAGAVGYIEYPLIKGAAAATGTNGMGVEPSISSVARSVPPNPVTR